MFSALRKLTSKNEAAPTPVPSNVQTMSSQLQRKFAKGIQYNMKIVIKGDNNVGKTCLFNRLQGKPFCEAYESTPEIQVASIQWSYKATDDVVKVEIWDVVDKAKKKKKMEGLKLENSSAAVPEELALDAEFLDVYKGTHGVVVVLDITKPWTFEYAQREVPRIPGHIPVLILGNHRDMGHHRQVRADDVRFFAEHVERPGGEALVRYAESSMRNGFGLKLLHRFLNVPFLTLQRDCLLTQLATNDRETLATHQELDVYEESDDANYDVFIDHLTNRRRQTADAQAPAQKMPHSQTTVALHNAAKPATGGGLARSVSQPGSLATPAAGPGPPSPSHPTPPPPPPAEPAAVNGTAPAAPGVAAAGAAALQGSPERQNVDAFVPDGALDASFLDEATPHATPSRGAAAPPQPEDSDDDVTDGNPMVAGFQDDIDDLDLMSGQTPVRASRPAQPDSSDDEPPPPPPKVDSPEPAARRRRDARLAAPPAPDEPIVVATGEDSEPEEPSVQAQTDSTTEVQKTKKKKKKDKEKDKENGEKKKKKKQKERSAAQRERDALEDFLEGDSAAPVDEAYEAI